MLVLGERRKPRVVLQLPDGGPESGEAVTLTEGSLPVLLTTSALLHLCAHLLFILGRVGRVERLLLRDLNETSNSNIACKGGQVSPSLPVLSQSHTLIAAPRVVERTSGRLRPVSPHHPCLPPCEPSATSGEASGPAMNTVWWWQRSAVRDCFAWTSEVYSEVLTA